MEADQRTFVIAGNGLTAWMAAAALAHALDRGEHSIVVVRDREDENPNDAIEPADATLPWPDHVRVAMDLLDDRLVVCSGGSFSLGVALTGWSGGATTWFHPFSTLGAAYGPVAFHQVVARLRSEGDPIRLSNYSLAALAAQAGRFEPPGSDPKSVLSTCRHGLHADTAGLTRIMKQAALAAGVRSSNAPIDSVLRAADGSIESLQTRSGERIEGDLYLDCTGTAARLIGNEGPTAWETWLGQMPCDQVLSATAATTRAPLPYSHAEANESGWTRYLPLPGRTVLTAFFSRDHADEQVILNRFRQFAGQDELQVSSTRDFSAGRRGAAWHRNCLALGPAAALTDPVGVSNLQLLRFDLNRLLSLLPSSPTGEAEAAEYNRQHGALLDNVRDFATLHYRLNGRRGEPFWDACRAMPVRDALDYRVRLYQNLGRVALYDEEPLEEASWIHLFDELGIRPRRYSAIADGLDPAALRTHLERIRAVMMDAVGKMPLHGDTLSRILGRQNTNQGNIST